MNVLRFKRDFSNSMFVHMITMLVMQMPVVQIVYMVPVRDCFMPAARTVHMVMVLMYFATH
jgi:hypothetical protein